MMLCCKRVAPELPAARASRNQAARVAQALRSAALLAGLFSAQQVLAQMAAQVGTQQGAPGSEPSSWQFSGFGALGLVGSDTPHARFHREGQATPQTAPRLDAEVDSNLGLQLDLQPAPGWRAMVQSVAMRRFDPHVSAALTWATLEWQGPGSTLWRAGRMALPVYAESDSRYVGYAAPWLRPPAEVYGLALVERLSGADLRWQGEGALQGLQLTALAGSSRVERRGADQVKVRQVRGLALAWAPEPGISLQASQVEGQVLVDAPGLARDHLYRFSSLSAQWVRPAWLAQAECVWRRSPTDPQLVNARGWYLMSGLRQGAWTSYALLARSDAADNSGGAISGSQRTLSAGVRWDLAEHLALKLQMDHVRVLSEPSLSFSEQAGPGPVSGLTGPAVPPVPGPLGAGPRKPSAPISVIGVALNFVF